MSFNRIILVGNLGRDPELRYTPQGTPVCTFSLATNERRKDTKQSTEQKELTTWFRVTLWGRQAEAAAQYLQKGRAVYVEGRLRVEEYTDREGKARYSLEVNATDLQFIDGGGREAGASPGARRAFAAVPEGRPSPQPGAWTLKDGKPIRVAAAEMEGAVGSSEDEESPF